MKKNKVKTDLPNFHRVNDYLYRGGQPTHDGLRQLRELGIKTIVTFREARETIIRERELAEELGFIFINLHLSNWFAARDNDIRKIIKIITDPVHHPVFIHCKRGADRTGTVVAVHRMLVDGWHARDANAEAKKHGIGWWQIWMKDYIKGFYKRMKKENL